jgi:hypothetical protein
MPNVTFGSAKAYGINFVKAERPSEATTARELEDAPDWRQLRFLRFSRRVNKTATFFSEACTGLMVITILRYILPRSYPDLSIRAVAAHSQFHHDRFALQHSHRDFAPEQ